MIRSLYMRVALTFLASVFLGLICAFFVTNYWFRDTFEMELQDELQNTVQDLVETFQQMNDADLDSYLNNRHWLKNFYVTLYDSMNNKREYGLKRQERFEIEDQDVEQVLKGEIARHSGEPRGQYVGYPFTVNGQKHAVFIQAGIRKEGDNFRNIILTNLAITLVSGSLFVLIAARYLVRPLKGMTLATRRISKGDFNVSFGWHKRKDELGELARSFNHMAAELKQLEQMRQDFVSSVSHEIQSPLTSITGFTKLIRSRQMPEEERNQYLDIIQTESERLSRLSENLLKLASLESEHHPYHPTTYRLDEQIRRIIVAQEPLWLAKEVELDLTLPPVIISADEDQLSQVWINLLTNAAKFSSQGGLIQVELLPQVDRVQVSIRDYGIGISQGELNHIFDKFYKADRSRHREAGGSGLGLAIVHKIIDLHGGSITVQSEPGKGSQFLVTLPSVAAK
ncbi:HAMP domain-containing protein [Paenibacillus sp. LMG 31456]|uniref:Heme sensor protein HssS n=1 Tax=Paenibacillus foliorum TaxID=2654974 RepID=A0A972H0V0_9BACL|nr:HAMP domain-containing sensor histidine kinase [Paenibacillus foliorum]NOU98159.1 HAMP domain-containing protein [Paenibacillus foliorum]